MNPTTLRVHTMASIVIAISAVVIYGWGTNTDALLHIIPGAVTMKPVTAFTFGVQGLALWLLVMDSRTGVRAGKVLALLSFAPVIYALLPYIGINVELFEGATRAAHSYRPGVPSLGTVSAFAFAGTAMAGMCILTKRRWARGLLSYIVSMLGIVALIGYAIDQPALYYEVEGFSTAMAVHTSILFISLGEGLKIWSGVSTLRDWLRRLWVPCSA